MYKYYYAQVTKGLMTEEQMDIKMAESIIQHEEGVNPEPPMQDPYSLAYYADEKIAFEWVKAHYSAPDIYKPQIKEFSELIQENFNSDPLRLNLKKQPSIIEVGCGGGREAPRLSKMFNYLGIDISPAMVSIAKDTNPGIKFQQGDLFNIDLSDKSVDGIFSAAVLHHVLPKALPTALSELRRIAKDNSIFFSSVREGDPGQEVTFDEKTGLIYFCQHESTYIPMLNKAGFQSINSSRLTSPGGINYLYNFSRAIPTK